jgi:asparagine synthase (glutamine-hydrolysing)
MCGIAGVYALDKSGVDLDGLRRMTSAIRHRGPDGEGHWVNAAGDLGLGHRRLAVVDLSELGAQPMHYAGRYTVTLNGEVYNYIEIREELSKRGYRFASESDTEVLLAAYQEYGVSVLDHLDGMFAFAIWDDKERTLFCARDRFGEKPFFYHHAPGRLFAFASEVKALFALGAARQVNYGMLFNYLAYDVVENIHARSETFYDGISKLEAAHYILIDGRGNLVKRRYWAIPEAEVDARVSFDGACEKFRELFSESVRRRLRADVPVGTSLSGGLDSTSVLCTISEVLNGGGRGQKSFSARFHDEALDEGPYMRLAAEAVEARPYFTWLDAGTLVEEIDKVFYHQEEPFGTPGIVAQWEVMKLAKQNGVTVLLDGQGADETLGGYTHYFRALFLELYSKDRARLGEEVRAYEGLYKKSFEPGRLFRLEATRPEALRLLGRLRRRLSQPPYMRHLAPDFVAAYKTGPPPLESFNDLNRTLRHSTEGYGLEKLLRFADRNSMAFSREVRLPFLNHRLVEFLFTLPASYKISGGWTKRLLRHSMQSVIPKEIAWRVNKLGFDTPHRQWFNEPAVRSLIEASRAQLTSAGLIKEGAKADPWQCVMTARLMDFAAGRYMDQVNLPLSKAGREAEAPAAIH